MTYGIFDIILDSDIPLPELPRADVARARIRVRSEVGEPPPVEEQDWFHHWRTPQGESAISCARVGGDYLLRFPGLVDFTISRAGDSVRHHARPGIPPETVRHLLLDQVVPRVLGQQGRFVMHASAVVLPDGRSVAFLGDSGRGKSTLASWFHEQGARLVTDDCLLIGVHGGRVIGIPNYYGLRLFSDSAEAVFTGPQVLAPVSHYTGKTRVVLSGPDQAGLPAEVSLEALFVLGDPVAEDPPDSVSVRPVAGANELMALLRQMFVIDPTDRNLIRRQFENVGAITSCRPAMYRLDYPRDHALLPQVGGAVRGAVA